MENKELLEQLVLCRKLIVLQCEYIKKMEDEKNTNITQKLVESWNK
ncbi:hypothetical protein [Spiroplasma sp. SV19]|nr:hypothetical protein [Spiroplasma sp. SV19]